MARARRSSNQKVQVTLVVNGDPLEVAGAGKDYLPKAHVEEPLPDVCLVAALFEEPGSHLRVQPELQETALT